MVEMYNGIKDQQKQAADLNTQSEAIIKELEKENSLMKDEKMQVAKANVDASGQLEAALKQYEELKAAFLKIDDVRYSLNKIMGPGGSMSEAERKIYLNNQNLADHDKMLEYAGARS